jgi:hypothetical protein
VADPKFSQPEQRNFLVPIVLALVVLGLAFFLYTRLAPIATIDITVPHTNIFGARTVFKTDTTLIDRDKAEEDLYILVTLHLDNHTKLPLFIKDFNATLITGQGEELTSSAAQKDDLPNLYTAFPDLRKMASTPLIRDTTIQPGQSAEGMVLFHFSAPQDAWDYRKSASISVDFYHQPPQRVSLDTNRRLLPPK